MSKGTVLSLCDLSGNMVRPWAEDGYDCWCIDLAHQEELNFEDFPSGGSITYVKENVLDHTPTTWDMVFAFPPCTDIAVSGAAWFRDKGLGKLISALTVVEACRLICELSGGYWMIENPVSVLSSYWRKPDHIFNPCDYGGYAGGEMDGYTKKTCLWTGGGFVMPTPKPIPAVYGSKMHKLPPSEDRARLRSITPKGFAQAVFEYNKKELDTAC